MAFNKKTWLNRATEHPTRRTIKKLNGDSEVIDFERNEGEVYQEGDVFSAENMNDMEGRIDAALSGYSLVKTTEAGRGTDPTVIYFCT